LQTHWNNHKRLLPALESCAFVFNRSSSALALHSPAGTGSRIA